MTSREASEIPFDENWYLAQNRDVAQHVRAGRLKSGLDHYLAHGRDEGRLPLAPAAAGRPGEKGAANHAQPAEPSLRDLHGRHNGPGFLNPCDLSISETPIRRIALIGSCFLECWGFHKSNPSHCVADVVLVNNAGVLPEPPLDGGEQAYDFQVIQIPLRSVLKDGALWHPATESLEAHERAFEQACGNLSFLLKSRMQWNLQHGLLSFVSNFLLPQRNSLGCLFPRFDLRNPEFFLERLNEHLEKCVRGYKNAYVLDVDRISASLGRRYIQDDLVVATGHNALLGTPGEVSTRIEPMQAMVDHFEVTWPGNFRDALWSEMVTMYRTVRQIDSVKLVVVDLDDTLWNGVSGDLAEVDPFMVEGWPLGVVEALCYLKKRGILLAIISKNDEQRVREIWPKIFLGRIAMEDFAAIRINWKPKATNLAEILAGICILPRNVVFIDDNPAERAAMKLAFPDVRILGRHPYYLRQTLLWSSETQVVSVTGESSQRTDMVKAQLEREARRTELSRADFLMAAAPTVRMIPIRDAAHPRFARAFELINKTNQFNTTGRRWTSEQCHGFFQSGGVFHAFEVTDAYTGYGLVGVVLLMATTITQWVMSCRILGFEIEVAVMGTIVSKLREDGAQTIHAHLVETDVNLPCRDLFAKCGFVQTAGEWVLPPGVQVSLPAHVRMEQVSAGRSALP